MKTSLSLCVTPAYGGCDVLSTSVKLIVPEYVAFEYGYDLRI